METLQETTSASQLYLSTWVNVLGLFPLLLKKQMISKWLHHINNTEGKSGIWGWRRLYTGGLCPWYCCQCALYMEQLLAQPLPAAYHQSGAPSRNNSCVFNT